MATASQLEPIDVEEAIAADLTSPDVTVFPPPVPEDLGSTLPIAVVKRDGGARSNPYVDSHNLTISVWGGTWASAMQAANALAGSIARLPQMSGTSVHWRSSDITGLPANSPDPSHPSIPRVQFTAAITCRTTT